jgi:hypothetical protein
MVGPNWPNAGEIDILEGVHEQESNTITLHTGAGCSIGSDTSAFAGDVATQNCDIKASGQAENAGCSIGQKNSKSYGAGLNSNGGGVFATEWTSEAISVWFFARGEVAADVLGENPDPSSWGKPAAKFEKSGCDIDSFFKDQQIVFDTTFCGDWAGNTWGDSCAAKTGVQTCNDYVRDNPEAFTNAFWTVNALKVYSNDGSASPQPSKTKDGNSPSNTSESTDKPTKSPESPDGPATTDAPVTTDSPEGPVTSDAPVASSSGFESPPIVDPSEVSSKPSSTDAASVSSSTDNGASAPAATEAPTRTRTRHRGGGPRTQRSVSAESAAPSVQAAEGAMGGFTWPAANPAADTAAPTSIAEDPTPTAAPTSVAQDPVPTAAPTSIAEDPVPTAAPTSIAAEAPVSIASQSLSSVDWNTVPSFSATLPPGVPSATAPASTNTEAATAPTAINPVPEGGATSTHCTKSHAATATVVEPVHEGEPHTTPCTKSHSATPTVVQPVGEGGVPTTPCTKSHPAATAAVRMARHAREHRRRMVKHNARK